MNRQPMWMLVLKIGDVLKSARGSYRVVRRASHHEDGRLRSVTFAIRRRSWTNRAYTVMTASDLLTFGYQPVGARIKLTNEMDARLHKAIHDNELPPNISLHAADVLGIP